MDENRKHVESAGVRNRDVVRVSGSAGMAPMPDGILGSTPLNVAAQTTVRDTFGQVRPSPRTKTISPDARADLAKLSEEKRNRMNAFLRK